jgi:hypothetical protein
MSGRCQPVYKLEHAEMGLTGNPTPQVFTRAEMDYSPHSAPRSFSPWLMPNPAGTVSATLFAVGLFQQQPDNKRTQ